LGNLTLLTSKLNSKVSNGPWLGTGGKREALHAHDVLMLNRQVLKGSEAQWTDEMIHARTRDLIQLIIQIWPVPPNHQSGFLAEKKPSYLKKVELLDLMNGGFLTAGISLFPRRKKYSNRVATLLPDGKLEVEGVPYARPSDAASAITGKRTNGWWFFLIDQNTRVSLRNVRRDYIDALAVDAEEDESDQEAEDDDV